ncbi:hypothetical protein P152DRAFT_518000 [Eremomyces bilateralis CBS 781.70]|uniref:Myb-like domain-containing protein n=1 Tax=Eremomyces bilateralis CBS 781.70 TaxID=1392243 RepID=A0A6G1FPU2_9PEZI|nr:uncharacterized protein P152DRAFT_518000 [Eremomyces bilateralis CBS 781.70]KAF1807845.1 hypothetical protein P152DRAFT_518000 [Eremomyces bilateralis CBS 781.70]
MGAKRAIKKIQAQIEFENMDPTSESDAMAEEKSLSRRKKNHTPKPTRATKAANKRRKTPTPEPPISPEVNDESEAGSRRSDSEVPFESWSQEESPSHPPLQRPQQQNEAKSTQLRPSSSPPPKRKFPLPITVHRLPDQLSASQIIDRGGSATPAPNNGKAPRLRWTVTMEEEMLQELKVVNQEGKGSDGGFKKTIWEQVARRVGKAYSGPAKVEFKNCKSKFEDTYKADWSKWQEHLGNGLSGWGDDGEGLPQADPETMDRYFNARPHLKKLRHSKPKFHDLLQDILGDRMATGAFAKAYDDEAFQVDSDSMEERSDEEGNSESDYGIFGSAEASRSSSVSTELSKSTSGSSQKIKKRSEDAKSFRKSIAEKEAKRRKLKQSKSSQIINSLGNFKDEAEELVNSMMKEYRAANENLIRKAVALAKKELSSKWRDTQLFQVFDLLQNEAKADTFLELDDAEQRVSWVEYELQKAGVQF